MAENQTEEYVLNTPRKSRTFDHPGLSALNWMTPLGSEVCCGTSEPGTAAKATSSSRNSAVRMLVSCRQKKRRYPTNPSRGFVTSATGASKWSDGRFGSVCAEAPESVAPPSAG
jgi:hypothetical protein